MKRTDARRKMSQPPMPNSFAGTKDRPFRSFMSAQSMKLPVPIGPLRSLRRLTDCGQGRSGTRCTHPICDQRRPISSRTSFACR